MQEILFSAIPLKQLEESIEKIVDSKIRELVTLQATNTSNDQYLTRQEVANLLHISKPTLRNLTNSGTLKSYRIGQRILYKPDEVASAVENIRINKYKRHNA